uniref:Uncharacterized protein n=2 Tax=Spongospora subterranea TaxID=70186 RepID=A0A0H5QFL8_9EUKA|eukprot:CRZ00750.1 hypothetical protein [Spongospora subterranea]
MNQEQIERRQWRMSKLSPYAANIAIHLYRCDKNQRAYIGIFHNEQMIKLPFCGNSWLCSLTSFEKYIAKVHQPCDHQRLCLLNTMGEAKASVRISEKGFIGFCVFSAFMLVGILVLCLWRARFRERTKTLAS